MRQELQNKTVESYGELSSAHFGISANDQAHIIGILRNRLYSDKIMAVLREYGTNAWDAHVQAGIQDQPISIMLPSKFHPVLKIRDYGPGIAEKEIYNAFIFYGNSTKRDTNTVIGMLGIGCKSGFAYSDVFTVVSYHAGIKKTYTAFIDDTNLGKMTKLAEDPCGDETGIEIQIPTRNTDTGAFHTKAKELFQYFNPHPIINIDLPTRDYIATGTGWSIRERWDGGPVAIMGNIGYPIKCNRLNNLPENVKSMLNSSIDLFFPIGALNIAASREDLEYTDKTLRAIQTGLELCQRELQTNLKKKFDEAKNLYEAREIYMAAVADGQYQWQDGHQTQNLTYLVAYDLRMWKGHDLSATRYKPLIHNDTIEVRAMHAAENNTVGTGSRRWNTFDYRDNPIIALADVKHGWVARARKLREELTEKKLNSHTILIVRVLTDDLELAKTEYEQWIKSCQLQGAPTYQLSKYDIGAAKSPNGTRKKNKKTHRKVFRLKTNDFNPKKQAPSDNWEIHEADLVNGTGIWIEIHGFRPVEKDPTQNSLVSLGEQLNSLKAIGVDLSQTEITGVKTKEKNKVNKNWIQFADWYDKKIIETIKNNPNTLELLRTQAVLHKITPETRFAYRNRARSLIEKGLDERHPIAQYFIEIWKILNKNHNWTKLEKVKAKAVYGAIAALPDAQRPKVSYNSEEKALQLTTQYPMLEYSDIFYINQYGYWKLNDQTKQTVGKFDDKTAKQLVEYIQLIDSQGKNS